MALFGDCDGALTETVLSCTGPTEVRSAGVDVWNKTWLTSLVLLVLAQGADAATVPSYAFKADLGSQSHVHTEGTVAGVPEAFTTAEMRPNLTEPTPTSSLLKTPLLKVVVYESRVTKVGPNPPGGVLPSFVSYTTTNYVFKDASMFLDKLKDNATWLLATGTSVRNPLSTGPGATCNLTREEKKEVTFHGVDVSASMGSPALPHWVVAADCIAKPERLPNDATTFLWDTRLHIIGIQLDENGQSQGTKRLDLETGTSREPNPTVPYVKDTVHRVAVLDPDDARTDFVWNFTTHFILRSQQVHLLGRLEIPQGVGPVSWGSAYFSRTERSFDVEGAFQVLPSQFVIATEGLTWEGPHSASVAGTAWGAPIVAFVASILLAAGVLLLRWVAPFVAGLYNRLTRREVLDNERRKAILNVVEGRPGISVNRVAQRLSIPRTTAAYHVRVLARQGLLQPRRLGRDLSLFMPGSVSWSDQDKVRRLRRPALKDMIQFLREHPRSTQESLAQALGFSQSYASRLLQDLSDMGVLESERENRRIRYAVREEALPQVSKSDRTSSSLGFPEEPSVPSNG